MKVLWLASWYPNKLSPYDGDFFKRHAEAVSLYEDVHVIYVVKDVYGRITRNISIEETVTGRLTETIVYYHTPATGFAAMDRLISHRKYLRLFKSAILKSNKIRRTDLVNVHMSMKAGILAKWLKSKHKIPFVISEQWGGFSPDALDGFSRQSYYMKFIWKKIVAEAESISVVSNFLIQCMKKYFRISDYVIIPNVVNDKIFSYDSRRVQGYKNFVFISTLSGFKNPKLIFAAFNSVVKDFPYAQLTVVGPHENRYSEWIIENQLEKNILFFNEMPQAELVKFIKAADALLLYSSYETFGCVIAEANTCGVPVIVSDIPTMRELVKQGSNGFFATVNNADALATTIKSFIRNMPEIDNQAIALDSMSKYNYAKVGKMFSGWYKKTLNADT